MRKCPLKLASLAAFFLGWPLATAAFALERIQIDTESAQRLVHEIVVPGGHSVVLSFDNGQYIHSIWVDDQSILGVATDRPLCAYQDGAGSDCGFARLIRLRRFTGADLSGSPLSGPSFSSRQGQATLLTVITTDSQGQNQQTYQFLATTTVRQPSNVSFISIVPTQEPEADALSRLQRLTQNYNIAAIKIGRDVAITQGLGDDTSQAWLNLEKFIDLVDNNGYAINAAIQESAVSTRLLDELQRLSHSPQI